MAFDQWTRWQDFQRNGRGKHRSHVPQARPQATGGVVRIDQFSAVRFAIVVLEHVRLQKKGSKLATTLVTTSATQDNPV